MTTVLKKIYTDGRVEEVSEKMNLAEMQKFVGGYIEYVPTPMKDKFLVINEEGMIHRLPPNPVATPFVHPHTLVSPGGIRGNALLVEEVDDEEE